MGVRRRNEKEELRAAMWVQRNPFFARSRSVRATYFLCTKFILKTKFSGATRARSLCFIRGPTHVTQTDVWVSGGDTLSLFKRRGNLVSGNWC